MKIGVITLPFHTNYGGILQAYALQIVLERMGHDVYFVKRTNPIDKVIPKIKELFKRILVCLTYTNIRSSIAVRECRRKNLDSFVKNNIHKYYYLDTNNNPKLDILISGSDQVWRDWGEGWDLMFYFFDFARKWTVKRYSYAASFGVDQWSFPINKTKEIVDLLHSFDKISVRENNAISLIKEKANIDALWLLDPTMLLTVEDYKQELMVTAGHKYKLISYILDSKPEKQDVIEKIEEAMGCDNYDIGNPLPSTINGLFELPTISEWLSNFMGAVFVVTDSFHGTAFSINFNKDFVVLSNQLRGQSRLLSILEMYGLEDRLVANSEDAENKLRIPIDWSRVNERLAKEREKSFNFLKNI